MAALVTEAKPRQLQVARIRQEEDEGCWISSEELHTDGSSDEEGGRWGSRHPHHPLHLHHPLHHLLQQHHSLPPAALGILSPLATKGGVRGDTNTPLSPPPPTASEPALQDAPHLTETTRRLSELGVEGIPLLQGAPPSPQQTSTDDTLEEQEDIMLWRPKRGSLKLPPHIDLAAITAVASAVTSTTTIADSDTNAGGLSKSPPKPAIAQSATAATNTRTGPPMKPSCSLSTTVMASVAEVPCAALSAPVSTKAKSEGTKNTAGEEVDDDGT